MGRSDPTPEEQSAFDRLTRVLGVDVQHYDTAGRQAAVDAIMHYPDGRSAALEVSSIIDQDRAEIAGLLARDDHQWTISGLRWGWRVQVWSTQTNIRQVRASLPEILRFCESRKIVNPAILRYDPTTDPEVLRVTYLVRDLHMRPQRVIDAPAGSVEVRARPTGAAVYPNREEVPEWLSEEAERPRTASKIAKLVASGHDERHLYLDLHPPAVPEAVWFEVAVSPGLEGEARRRLPYRLPDGEPMIEGVTDVWLTGGTRWMIHWQAGRGWSLHDLGPLA